MMVRLARGGVSERTARELTSILQALRHDATLTPRLGEVVKRFKVVLCCIAKPGFSLQSGLLD